MTLRLAAVPLLALALFPGVPAAAQEASRPNLLLAISDDQSWEHTSAAGSPFVRTPAFDRVARAGVFFRRAFAASPGCSPSRAALLTGRHHWQLEEAGTHASSFQTRYVVYPDLLEKAGYAVGMTGKGWGPGDWKVDGRTRNPAGPAFAKRTNVPPASGIAGNDYAGNFEDFLAQRPANRPFCFWYGASEPHRGFEKGSGLKAGKRLEEAVVPPFLPDTPEVRSDLLDYAIEIEWFDRHLGRMLDRLHELGELERTLVIVTSDNGMAFPRAKANLYEHGIRVPLAVAWPERVPGNRVVDDPVGFVDLTATIYEASGVASPLAPEGRSLLPLLASGRQGRVEPGRDAVFAGRERHSSSRPDNLGYPSRALRTPEHLYVRNFRPERWPAGDPMKLGGKPHDGYHDIDGCPTLDLLLERRNDPSVRGLFALAVDRRPAEELFDLESDPGCLRNLAGDPAHETLRARLAARLDAELRRTGDPRVGPDPEIWETYRRYSPIRRFPPSPERLPE